MGVILEVAMAVGRVRTIGLVVGALLLPAGVTAAVLGLAEWLQLLLWPPHYVAGDEEQWPLDVLTTAWLTGSCVALSGCWIRRVSTPWNVIRAVGAIVGVGAVAVSWVQWRAVPPAGESVTPAEVKVGICVLLGAVLALLGRFVAVRAGVAIPLIVVTLAAIYNAFAPWQVGTGGAAIGKLPWTTYMDTQRLSVWVTGALVVILAGVLALWCTHRDEPAAVVIVGAGLGVAFLLGTFYLVGFDSAPDHSTVLDPLHRVRVWLTCVFASAAGTFLARVAVIHHPRRVPVVR